VPPSDPMPPSYRRASANSAARRGSPHTVVAKIQQQHDGYGGKAREEGAGIAGVLAHQEPVSR
jgi:hypothetical protein